MERLIKINCKKVYDAGNKYEEEIEIIKDMQTKLENIKENIANTWQGADSHNFQVSFEEHIRAFDDIIDFLDDKATTLKGSALEHSNIDNNLNEKMKRSEIDGKIKC